MWLIIIGVIALYVFGLSLCVAAGIADESAEKMERDL